MKRSKNKFPRTFSAGCGLLLLLASAIAVHAQPNPAAAAAFDSSIRAIEARLNRQRQSKESFLASLPPGSEQRLRRGELVVVRLAPEGGEALPGALLHHWRGTAFVRGATTAEFEWLLHDFPNYPRFFAPQVTRAAVLAGGGDHLHADMRVVQRHVITVVLDTSYDVTFGRLDARHGWSTSRSTRIAEIDGAGTARERALAPGQDHGFLWQLNTYWSYEERDGGLYLQIESISLSRGIPTGLGWAVRPFIESVPRESLEFTLRAARKQLLKQTTERSER